MSKSNRNQAHKESLIRTQYIVALRSMDVVISAALDLRIRLCFILKQVTTLSTVQAATILLLDPNSLQLKQIISHSTPGEKIPLAARIFAVIDVWTALRSERAYRQAWSDEDAENYIPEQAGKQFDPTVVDAFLKMREG